MCCRLRAQLKHANERVAAMAAEMRQLQEERRQQMERAEEESAAQLVAGTEAVMTAVRLARLCGAACWM